MDLSTWQTPPDDVRCMDIARAVASVFADRLPLAHPLVAALTRGDWQAVAKFTVDYKGAPEEVFLASQIIALFKKAPFLPVDANPVSTAFAKFVESEANCKRINKLLRLRVGGRFCFDPLVERILFSASRKIAKVLGDLPEFSSMSFRFTSGASTELKKKDTSIRSQLMADLACSEGMYRSGLAAKLMQVVPNWSNTQFAPAPDGPQSCNWRDVVLERAGYAISYEKHVPSRLDAGYDYGGNVGYDAPFCPLREIPLWVRIDNATFEFVPKTAFEARVIIKEPPLNKYVQTAYGDVIRDRLKAIGLDIRRLQPRQSELARLASLTAALATVDLTSASDNIAYLLVMDLLPYDWFAALEECRSETVYSGENDTVYKLEKFSGMGNGYTFPLQTLIFWSLAKSCAEIVSCEDDTVSVYGDDIVCPVECIPNLLRVFSAIGFHINQSKSFWEGGFRESCGTDWLFGINVRPIYVKDYLSMEKLYLLHNGFFRLGEYEAAERVLSYIKHEDRMFGPDGFGDGHLLACGYIGEPYLRSDQVKIWNEREWRTEKVRDAQGNPVRGPTGYDLRSFRTVALEPRCDWDTSSKDHAAVLVLVEGASKRRVALQEHSSEFSAQYQLALKEYLGDGMSIALLGHAIKRARNAVMRHALPDEVVPTRQRRRGSYLLPSDPFDVNGSVVTSEYTVLGMPLPGSEEAQIRTICFFAS